MTEAFWLAIIVGVGSPLLLAMLHNWSRAREREEDRAERRAVAKELAAVGTKIDGMLVDRDKAKVLEGERKGEQRGADKAATLAEGQRQGVENERAAAAAAANPTPPNGPPKLAASEDEVPTKDRRVAEASERIAVAQERVASATEKKAEKP